MISEERNETGGGGRGDHLFCDRDDENGEG